MQVKNKMTKRFIRVDLEYEYDSDGIFSWTMMDNIKRAIREDMPYVKVLFCRDSPSYEGLNQSNNEIGRLEKK